MCTDVVPWILRWSPIDENRSMIKAKNLSQSMFVAPKISYFADIFLSRAFLKMLVVMFIRTV